MRSPRAQRWWMAISLAFVVIVGVGAQQQPAIRLTLEDAQARALEHSHRLAEARARESVAAAVVEARQALERPSIGATASYQRTSHVDEFSFPGPTGPRVVYPDVPNNYQARLDLQWPIYSGGRTDALERAARAEAAAVGAEADVARADLRLEVARTYWALVTSRASVSVLEQGVARSESHIGDVRARFSAGLVAPNETASAEAQAARARMLLIEARNQRDAAAADLARLIGEEPFTLIEPAATLDQEPADLKLRLDATRAVGVQGTGAGLTPAPDAGAGASGSFLTLTEQARAGRAERQAMARRIEGAEAQQAAAAAGRRPTIAATAGIDYARPNARIFPRVDRWNEFWDAGIRVTWSLWDGGRVAADVAQAVGLATAARERLAEFDAVLRVDVRQRLLDIESGLAAVQAAGEGIRAAEEARRVVSERYRAGVLAQGEVLDAELALLQAQLDRTRALAGVRLAEARLARAIGR